MTRGYTELNTNISDTINMIDSVAKASKDQEDAIEFINQAIDKLENETGQNANMAHEISHMSKHIENLSNSLVATASRASFIIEAKEGVCNVDLVYDTAKLKVNLLRLKDSTFSQLGSYGDVDVPFEKNIEKWLSKFSETSTKLDKASQDKLIELNKNFYNYLVEFVEANKKRKPNEDLEKIAKKIEIESLRIFGTLNNIKKIECRG